MYVLFRRLFFVRFLWGKVVKKESQTSKISFKKQKSYIPKEEESIDEVKTIHIAKWDNLTLGKPNTESLETKPEYYYKRYDRAKLEFQVYKENTKKLRTKHKAFEQNLIANFWFLLGCPEENK